jgi:hypothetical protein
VTPNEFYYAKSKQEIEGLAKKAGTSFGNFKQIAIANGNVSKALAEKLANASNGVMTELEILYPERYKHQVINSSEKAA